MAAVGAEPPPQPGRNDNTNDEKATGNSLSWVVVALMVYLVGDACGAFSLLGGGSDGGAGGSDVDRQPAAHGPTDEVSGDPRVDAAEGPSPLDGGLPRAASPLSADEDAALEHALASDVGASADNSPASIAALHRAVAGDAVDAHTLLIRFCTG